MTDAGANDMALDEPRYYYQNPKSGTVSTTTLSIRQICKLLVPAREGLPTILTPQTMVVDTAAGAASEEQGSQQGSQQWKPVSSIDVLKEAATKWYYQDRRQPNADGASTSTDAVSCRALSSQVAKGDEDPDAFLVFAQGITPEWMALSKLPNLQLVFQALRQPSMQETLERAKQAEEQSEAASASAGDGQSEGDDGGKSSGTQEQSKEEEDVQNELEQFLSMANDGDDGDGRGKGTASGAGADDDNIASYQSDGGTRYVQDPTNGNWVHEAVAAMHKANEQDEKNSKKPGKKNGSNHSSSNSNNNSSSNNNGVSGGGADGTKKKKKHKKAQFAKKNAKNWIYVAGLPKDDASAVTINDIAKFFGRVGLIDLNPETMQPKIKLYKDRATGQLKGDASICYARPESVDLALQVLDSSPWDADHTLQVQRAHFEAKKDDADANANGGNNGDRKRRKRPVSEAQRKVARLALLQAQDDGFGERLAGGRKGLRIVIVERMVEGLDEDKWESTIHDKCEKDCGQVEKITVLSKNNNVVIVKFVEPAAASSAVQSWNNAPNLSGKFKMSCKYWDGVTDYTNSHENEESRVEEEKRHEDFGSWLEGQELPPELRLQVEGGGKT